MPAPESFPRRALRGGQWSNRKAAWPRQQIAYSCKCMAIVKARFGGGKFVGQKTFPFKSSCVYNLWYFVGENYVYVYFNSK
jgi:hypothetical protein